jgi:hypothetical protein
LPGAAFADAMLDFRQRYCGRADVFGAAARVAGVDGRMRRNGQQREQWRKWRRRGAAAGRGCESHAGERYCGAWRGGEFSGERDGGYEYFGQLERERSCRGQRAIGNDIGDWTIYRAGHDAGGRECDGDGYERGGCERQRFGERHDYQRHRGGSLAACGGPSVGWDAGIHGQREQFGKTFDGRELEREWR